MKSGLCITNDNQIYFATWDSANGIKLILDDSHSPPGPVMIMYPVPFDEDDEEDIECDV